MTITKDKLMDLLERAIQMSETTGVGDVRTVSMDEEGRPEWALVFVMGAKETESMLARIDREKVRPTLEQAIQAVEAQLKENDWKGGWEGCDIRRLLTRMGEELKELDHAVYAFLKDRSEDNTEHVGSEAADVQALAAMVADVAGCFPHGERINGHDAEGMTNIQRFLAAGWDVEEAAESLLGGGQALE